MVNFYQVGSQWLLINNYLKQGSCHSSITADNLRVSIRLYETGHQLYYGLISELQNESGVAYNATTLTAAFALFNAEEQVAFSSVSAELIRPADTTSYDAGDAINSATVAVKQKEIVTLTGSAPAKKKTTITLTGTMPRKDKYTITLSGTSGTADIKLVGGLTKLVTFATGGTTDLTQTAADFVTSHAAAYLAVGVTVTANTNRIIFEHVTAGSALVAPTITNKTGNLAGTVAHTTTPYVIGTANLQGLVGSPFLITAHTSLTQTAADFVTANQAAFSSDLAIDLTSSGADLILEAQVAGTPFQTVWVTTLLGDLTGTVVETTPNVVVGHLGINFATLGVNYDLAFVTSKDATAASFVTAHATALDALGIVATSSTDKIVLEAKVAGVPFTPPVLTTLVGDLAGSIAHTVANLTISAITLSNVVVSNGGGGFISEVKVETDATQFAGKIIRLWLFNAIPTCYGDNVAYVSVIGDHAKRLSYIDITFDALLANSTTVIGKSQPNLNFICATSNLYVSVQAIDAITTPKSAGKFELLFNIVK